MEQWIRRLIFGSRDSRVSKSGGEEMKLYNFKPLNFEECPVKGEETHAGEGAVLKPQPRSGHRIVCDKGNVYSFGGYYSEGTAGELLRELLCYNIAESRWIRLPNLGNVPENVASHAVVLHGNYLVVFGGTGLPFGEASSNAFSICDLRTLNWTTVETKGQSPIPRYGQAVLLDERTNSFYVTGGTDGYAYSMDIHKLDMNTFTWEVLFTSNDSIDEDMPYARYRHDVAFDGRLIYVLGGGTEKNVRSLSLVPAFDIKSRQWKFLQTVVNGEVYPRPRKCQSSVQLEDDVYMCGGLQNIHIFMDLWRLNLPTLTWTRFASANLPFPVYFHASCVTTAGCMYIFGGVTDIATGTRSNKTYKIWLKIPKLQEICWEAILNYSKNIKLMSQSNLRKIFPREFSDRVHPGPPCGPISSINKHWIDNSLPALNKAILS